MYILRTAPITKGVAKETLSYFSRAEVAPGTLVFIPLRNRVVPSLVLDVRRAANVKAQLRTSTFTLRPIAERKPITFLSREYIAAAQTTAHYSASTLGVTLHALVPQQLLALAAERKLRPKQYDVQTPKKLSGEKLVYQAYKEERVARYRTIIRESFARKESVFITVPTLAYAEALEEVLGRGIQNYVFVFHSTLPKKEFRERVARLSKQQHPVVLIATAPYLSLAPEETTTIILEEERSGAYKQRERPYLDMRYFIESYAQKSGIRLILADLPLSIETMHRFQNDELVELVKPTFRLLKHNTTELVDMREAAKQARKPFVILSEQLKTRIQNASEANQHTLLFTARRGIAPMTVCKDCGSVVSSADNSTPMVLMRGSGGNVFVSHKSGEVRSAHERCRNCKSWRLEALGIGIERAYDEMRKSFPNKNIFCISRETHATHRAIKADIEKYYATPGAILMGTSLVLPYLRESVDLCAVISADSLLSIPEWRMSERIFGLLITLQTLTRNQFIIQTRKIGEDILQHVCSGNIQNFMSKEIALRKQYAYPPFAVFIKLSIAGTPARIEKEMETLAEYLEPYVLHAYGDVFSIGRGKSTRHALLRVPGGAWPDEHLRKKLLALPPHVAVNVNPENLL